MKYQFFYVKVNDIIKISYNEMIKLIYGIINAEITKIYE